MGRVPSLKLAEVFGPTFQGEGPSAGRRCGFVRLSDCNLHCSWCDTPYTWDWSRYDRKVEQYSAKVDDVVASLAGMDVSMVVVTGGEPLMQRDGLAALISACPVSWRIEVETNGTRMPLVGFPRPDAYNVSVKLANNDADGIRKRIKPDAIRAFVEHARQRPTDVVWKFVARTCDDLDEVAALAAEYGLPSDAIWIMPEGTNEDLLLTRSRELSTPVLERGWNLTSRTHVMLWGDRRGV